MANEAEMLPNHAEHANVHAAAGVLMLVGAAATVSTVCNCNPDDADASQVFIAVTGLLAWLLGVCLVSLVPFLIGWFPQVDRFAGAAIANAGEVLNRFFIPWN